MCVSYDNYSFRHLELPGILQLHRYACFTRKLLRVSCKRTGTRGRRTYATRRVS